jgi:hypothetical protein
MTDPITKAPPPDAAIAHLPSILRWSLSDAWTWVGFAWRGFIHEPYLGLIGLVFIGVLAVRGVYKLMS